MIRTERFGIFMQTWAPIEINQLNFITFLLSFTETADLQEILKQKIVHWRKLRASKNHDKHQRTQA